MKVYFFSYAWTNALNKTSGNGRAYSSWKIKTFEDIEKIEKLTKDNNNFTSCSIQYYSTKPLKIKNKQLL